MISDKRGNLCWKVGVFGIAIFLLTASLAEANNNEQRIRNLGRVVIESFDRTKGLIRIRNDESLIFLSPSSVIYGQGKKQNWRVLRTGQSIQVYGYQVQGGTVNGVRASRIDVYENSEFWDRLNRH